MERWLERSRSRFVVLSVLPAGWLMFASARAAEPRTLLPSDAEAAWAEVEKAQATAAARPEWQGRDPKPEEVAKFQKQAQAVNRVLAEKAMEFATHFPTNENASEARLAAAYGLTHAVAAGDSASEEECRQFVARTLADQNIPEDDRVGVFLMAGNLALMKKLGMKFFVGGYAKFSAEFDLAMEETLLAAREKFPHSARVYSFLLALADRSKDADRQRRLAGEVLKSAGASAAVKTYARHVIAGTKPYEIGKPIDIQFTALDGREIDLAKLRGKVILVEFWATDCGPCVGEMPTVKSVYNKLHSRGFEIIGISLDDKESALRKFIREKDLPWAQYFDGQGWAGRFAIQYGVFGIPTMWLVDKRGNLRVTDARGNLEGSVTTLLDEKP